MEESSLKGWLSWDDLLADKGTFTGFLLEVKRGVFREMSIIKEICLSDGRVRFICQFTKTFIGKTGDEEIWEELVSPMNYSYDQYSFDLLEDSFGNIILDSGNFSGIIKCPTKCPVPD